MRRLTAEYRTALRRARSIPLSQWVRQRNAPTAERTRSGFFPTADGDYFITADHVIDDPREPRLTPTGILDSRGMMLVRVAVPIKVPMGFHSPRTEPDEPDEVETIIPEDMLAISDCGLGVGYVEPHEVEDDEPTIEEVIHAALEHCGGDPVAAKKLLAENGLEVEFEIKPKPAE